MYVSGFCIRITHKTLEVMDSKSLWDFLCTIVTNWSCHETNLLLYAASLATQTLKTSGCFFKSLLNEYFILKQNCTKLITYTSQHLTAQSRKPSRKCQQHLNCKPTLSSLGIWLPPPHRSPADWGTWLCCWQRRTCTDTGPRFSER